MSTNTMNDKVYIKELIFTKALPNYKIPVPTDGYKIFSCIDCGDKFLFESSYEHHISRKSLKITYFCRHCLMAVVFYNRCNLLSHIRSHAFKSATISVSDLKIEPLPLEHFNLSILQKLKQRPDLTNVSNYSNGQKNSVCYECSGNIYKHGVIYKDRAAHYMQTTTEAHSCPICNFVFPSICGLEAHLRIHLNIPPFFCPECGMHLPNKVASYPFDHDCKGFKMMKSATRLNCNIDGCEKYFPPEEYKKHFRSHLRKIYRCSFCLEMWYAETKVQCTLCKKGNISNYIQCPKCPKKLFAESLIERHVNSHCSQIRDKLNEQSYPCTACDLVFKQMNTLINHHVNIHSSINLKVFLSKFSFKEANKQPRFRKHVYHRVIKKCSKCLRSFTYRCIYENIKKLPIDCPFNCSSNTNIQNTSQTNETTDSLEIVCPLCKIKVNQSWINIKKHYAEFHRNHKCLDIQVLLHQVDRKLLSKKTNNRKVKRALVKNKLKRNTSHVSKETIRKKANSTHDVKSKSTNSVNVCIICGFNCENRQNLETHLITHRDPCMAYQCLECGKSFVDKAFFRTHLFVIHAICDVQAYIDTKPCTIKKGADTTHDIQSKSTNSVNACIICGFNSEDRQNLETHLITHRDPCMAYQCLECGKSFVDKASFRTHLFVIHAICDVQAYIDTKPCTIKKGADTTHDIQSKSTNSVNVCIICGFNCEDRQNLETHLITHRDPCMAYQCLECGKSFVVKASFATHLFLEHAICDVQAYIDTKPCYNELALLKDQHALNPPVEEPVKENQCTICREQFETSNDLEKHFRVHGMAFLMKNAQKHSTSP